MVIPTAEEFVKKCKENLRPYSEEMMLRSFARFHVKAALEAASKIDIKVEKKSVHGKHRKWQKVKEGEEFDLFLFEMRSSPNIKAILNVYSEENIK